MVECFQCGNKWEYKRQEKRFHICYSCQNRFETITRRGRVFVYLLLCLDNTIYTGITNNMRRRIGQHRSGEGTVYTREHGVKRLLAYKPFNSRNEAIMEEAKIKRLSHSQKLRIVKLCTLSSF